MSSDHHPSRRSVVSGRARRRAPGNGRRRSRRGRREATSGATTRSRRLRARRSAGPRTCPRATPASAVSSKARYSSCRRRFSVRRSSTSRTRSTTSNPEVPASARTRTCRRIRESATVISILVAIDECTTESGCLWIADGVRRAAADRHAWGGDDRGRLVAPLGPCRARSRRRALHRRTRTPLQRGEQERFRSKGPGRELRAGERELQQGPLLLGEERGHAGGLGSRRAVPHQHARRLRGRRGPRSSGPVAVGSCTHG